MKLTKIDKIWKLQILFQFPQKFNFEVQYITVRQALGKCFFAVSGVQRAEEIFDWGEILQRSRYSGSKIPGIVSKLHAIHQHLFVP